jgi:hypothetical protein
LRYQVAYDRNFKDMLDEKELTSELVCEFTPVLVMSEHSPLAQRDEIRLDDLEKYIELSQPDTFVPALSPVTIRKNETLGGSTRHVFIFERGSQMDLLSSSCDTYMWVSPIPPRLLELHGLVTRECPSVDHRYRDVLIRKRDYKLTDLDKLFIDELMRAKREFL